MHMWRVTVLLTDPCRQSIFMFLVECVYTMGSFWVVGIMLLEKQLLQIDDDGQSSHKRARSAVAPPSEVTTTWIELSK